MHPEHIVVMARYLDKSRNIHRVQSVASGQRLPLMTVRRAPTAAPKSESPAWRRLDGSAALLCQVNTLHQLEELLRTLGEDAEADRYQRKLRNTVRTTPGAADSLKILALDVLLQAPPRQLPTCDKPA